MIGLSFDDIAISEITLALFEDSGWYKMNYYTGGLFKFGKNQGCAMLNQKCITNNIPVSKKDYCGKISESLCQTNLMGRGFCYITNNANPDNLSYQYFNDNPKKGGLFIADFCPIVAVPTDKNYFYNWNCITGKSTYPSEYSEKIGTTSGCFMSNAVQGNSYSSLSSKSYRATCYAHSCDLIQNKLKVFVGNTVVDCPIAGGEMDVNNYLGKIVCPDFYSICSYKIPCYDIYDCISKRSEPASRTISYKPKESFTILPTEQAEIKSIKSEEKPNEVITEKTITDTLVTSPMTKPKENTSSENPSEINPVISSEKVPKDDGFVKPKVNPVPPPKELLLISNYININKTLFVLFMVFLT